MEGFSHLTESLSTEQFEELAKSLGNILTDFTVKLDPSRTSYVCHSDAIPFHTDDVTCRYIGWHCINQDLHDGSSLLLHTKKVFGLLTQTDLQTLSQIKIDPAPYALSKLPGQQEPYPLLNSYPSNPGICYVPWLKIHHSNSSQREVVERLKAAIAQLEEQGDFIEIKLQPGQALFIDNRRVFHGRRELRTDSARHLRRLWVGEAQKAEG